MKNNKSLRFILAILCFVNFFGLHSINAFGGGENKGTMKVVISLNGLDGSGKTTQLNLLKQTSNGTNTIFTDDISKFGTFPQKNESDFFNWWFHESSIEEFCDAIYKGIYLRQEEIEKSDKRVAVLDKGIDTFDARIIANFLCRGMDRETINSAIKNSKAKFGLNGNYETLKIFFDTQDSSDRLLKAKDSNSQDEEKSAYYSKYQAILKSVVKEQIEKGIYTLVNADGNVEEVNSLLMDKIKPTLNKFLLAKKYLFVTGPSESGKSGACDYLKANHKNIFRIKMRDIVARVYEFLTPSEEFSIWIDHEIKNSSSTFWNEYMRIADELSSGFNVVIMDTLRSPKSIELIKKIVGENFAVLYIDAPFELRTKREFDKVNKAGTIVTLSEIEKQTLEKDSEKQENGVFEILRLKNDYPIFTIVNGGTIEEFHANLEKFILSLCPESEVII